MKKTLCLIACAFGLINQVRSQAMLITTAPQFDNSTSTGRGPNGSSNHVTMRAVGLVLPAELAGIAPGTTLTTFGYTLNSGSTTNAATGNYTLYLQNTSDLTYNKGTNFSTAISTMTQVYAGALTIPISASSVSVTITLSTPFVYTGGGIYVAYDWYNPGPYSTTAASYRCNSGGLSPGLASIASTSSVAPTTLGTTAFRPCFLFGYNNPYVNENGIVLMDAPGKVAAGINNTYTVKAVIRNNSGVTATNLPVDLNITGANTFSGTVTIPSLAAGATTTVTLPAYTANVAGTNTITISLPSDELNTNNQVQYLQEVTCGSWAMNPPTGTYTAGIGFGTGSGILANNYTNTNASLLNGLKLSISSDVNTTGNNVYGVLLNSAGTILAVTNTIALAAGDLGTVKTFTFASSQNLSPATNYLIGVAQTANTTAYYPFGALNSAYVPFYNYVTLPAAGGTPAALTSNLGYFNIEAILTPTVTVTAADGVICDGSSYTISPTGASTYTYSSGSAVVSPTTTSTYTITGADANGCVNTTTNTVTVNALPVIVSETGDITVCGDATGTFSLVATNTSTYAWQYSFNSGSQTTINGTYNETGFNTPVLQIPTLQSENWGGWDISCVLTSVDGCTLVSAPKHITVNPLPNVTVSSGAICIGSSYTMTPGGALTYTYSSGTDVVTPTTDATYTVTGTDSNGCENMAVSSVTVNTLPSVTAATNNTLLCSGETATLSASGALTYTWSTGENTADVAVSPATQTTYTVTGADVNGCENTTTVTQDVNVCTGIQEANNALNLNLYPNPCNGLFELNLQSQGKVEIMDALGKIVYSNTADAGIHKIDLSQERSGVYYVKVITGNYQYTGKAIINK